MYSEFGVSYRKVRYLYVMEVDRCILRTEVLSYDYQ